MAGLWEVNKKRKKYEKEEIITAVCLVLFYLQEQGVSRDLRIPQVTFHTGAESFL